MSSTFGAWVAEQRYKQRLSARKACERSGLSPSQWSQIENRDIPREMPTIKKVAVGLGMDFNEVLNASLSAQGLGSTVRDDKGLSPEVANDLRIALGEVHKILSVDD